MHAIPIQRIVPIPPSTPIPPIPSPHPPPTPHHPQQQLLRLLHPPSLPQPPHIRCQQGGVHRQLVRRPHVVQEREGGIRVCMHKVHVSNHVDCCLCGRHSPPLHVPQQSPCLLHLTPIHTCAYETAIGGCAESVGTRRGLLAATCTRSNRSRRRASFCHVKMCLVRVSMCPVRVSMCPVRVSMCPFRVSVCPIHCRMCEAHQAQQVKQVPAIPRLGSQHQI
ncbi:unnamed protein product [Closterium sp. NIES-54]